MTARSYLFSELATAPLEIDCFYESGAGHKGGEPICKIIPGVGNSGGIRKAQILKGPLKNQTAYVVLVTSEREPEWPDFLDVETGVLHYYGDNRTPGQHANATRGNKLFYNVFQELHTGNFDKVPPFLVFRQTLTRQNVQFIGIAAPGHPRIPQDRDLVAFWRAKGNLRFQNYEAFFTILDTRGETISREWLAALRNGDPNADDLAPAAWKAFKKDGADGIKALKAKKLAIIPNRDMQLDCVTDEGFKCLDGIRQHYKGNPYGFEACAAAMVSMMDPGFSEFQLTRPWRDGGYDAIGYYKIHGASHLNFPLAVDCALEAKCYSPSNGVGVHEMSRLISRIRHRQFGIMVTTSYVSGQAYKEIVDDGHPILILTAADIARVLLEHSVTSANLSSWLAKAESQFPR